MFADASPFLTNNLCKSIKVLAGDHPAVDSSLENFDGDLDSRDLADISENTAKRSLLTEMLKASQILSTGDDLKQS